MSYNFDERPNQDVAARNEFLKYVKKECQKANIEVKIVYNFNIKNIIMQNF